MEGYAGKQYVGIDLHRRRTVIVRTGETGERLGMARIDNDPVTLAVEVAKAGPDAEVVLEACYGWYWAADVLAEEVGGERVHLAHPLGVKGFSYRRVKNDERDAADLADLLRMNRLPEAWIAPPEVRDLREVVRHRAKLVMLRSSLKSQVHAVLAKRGVPVSMSDVFDVGGTAVPGRPGPARGVRRPGRLAAPADRHAGLRDRHRGRSGSRPGCGTTPGGGRSRRCPGSARCWPRCSSPRSVTSPGSPARTS